MTAAPSMAEVLADLIADHPMWIGDDGQPLDYLPAREALIGDFVDEAAQALAAAGFGHVASVEARWQEVTGDPTPEHAAATTADIAASLKALAAERDAAEAQVAAVRALADELAAHSTDFHRGTAGRIRAALDGEGGR